MVDKSYRTLSKCEIERMFKETYINGFLDGVHNYELYFSGDDTSNPESFWKRSTSRKAIGANN